MVNKKAPWWPMSASTAPSGRMFFFFNAAFLAIVAVCTSRMIWSVSRSSSCRSQVRYWHKAGHSRAADQCPLSGVERTGGLRLQMQCPARLRL